MNLCVVAQALERARARMCTSRPHAALELPFSKEGDDSSEHGVRFARVSWARWHTGREFTRAVLKPQKVFACSVHVVLF